jgi:hypothetical protein
LTIAVAEHGSWMRRWFSSPVQEFLKYDFFIYIKGTSTIMHDLMEGKDNKK